ncbi:recombinase family protein [Urbifossiella limnaea]|uniref:Recombinase n=1 Tax=Urbifossiella limnaea TaxID=2528023 RepID=A0A517XQQ9_9BACT|nr:recombinase family protein [Urbifossiella limnaea]QDU19845.1 Recombinase [Urbifossiella limnaea]
MTKRPEKGRGLFYHRDSEAHSELAPPQYVEWARGEAARLGVSFSGTPEAITAMIARGQPADGDLYLDYGVSGNLLSRPGFDQFRERAASDPSVSHLFVSKRDRLGRPDNPLDSMLIEYQLRSAGLTIVLMGGKVLPAVGPGERIELADLLTSLIEYNESGKFRRDLAEKLIHAKIRLARGGFSIGGEPLYGFRRWLCAEDGTRKRQLEDHERVKLPGHHVLWLPTATEELAVVRRILDLIEATPAARVARILNAEGIPSPKAGHVRTRNGVKFETSGQWTQNTVRNIATHPLLIAVWEYGKRSEGDQLRFTKDGPRALGRGDYSPDGKLKTVANPADQIIRTPAKSDAVTTPEKFELVREVIAARGRHLKGKARTRGQSPNPLGGRIYDLTCGWLMYRYAKRGKWCYGCGLYQNSEARCCRHNTVQGETATRFVLDCLRQLVLTPSRLAKLKTRLGELADAERGDDPAQRQLDAVRTDLAGLRRKVQKAAENMALSETREERAAVAEVFLRLKDQESALERRLATHRPAPSRVDPQRQVEAALGALDRLAESLGAGAADWAAVGSAFARTNANLYLRFSEVVKGRKTFNVPAGGVVTFGSAAPPGPLYTGPTDRPIIRKMLAAGEPVTASPGRVTPGDSNAGQDVTGSANVQRGTRRCS